MHFPAPIKSALEGGSETHVVFAMQIREYAKNFTKSIKSSTSSFCGLALEYFLKCRFTYMLFTCNLKIKPFNFSNILEVKSIILQSFVSFPAFLNFIVFIAYNSVKAIEKNRARMIFNQSLETGMLQFMVFRL